MKTALLVSLALLSLASPALADDLLDASASVSVSGIDPAIDQAHTVSLRVFTDEAGNPGVELLVDGASPLP